MPAEHKDAVEMMCSIGEVAGLFEKSGSLDDFLQTAVSIIAWHMRAAVCSIFLIEPDQEHMILAANQGFSRHSIGTLRLRIGEGLTGKSVEENRVMRVARGAEHPDFKPAFGIGEEAYEGFLAVPIVRGATRIGALVVQDPKPDYFNERDSRALQAIATQLASVIENARLLLQARQRAEIATRSEWPKLIRGTALSRGVARGRALPISRSAGPWIRRIALRDEPRRETDFDRALKQTHDQLESLQQDLARQSEDIASMIFSSHLLILKDPAFTEPIRSAIRSGQTAQRAILGVFESYEELLQKNPNPRVREKVSDLEDLAQRLLGNLLEMPPEEMSCENRIVIVPSLTPSELVRLAAQRTAGVILLEGGAGTHVAILARSLNVPAMVIPQSSLLLLEENLLLLMDVDQGNLYIQPSQELISEYERLERDRWKISGVPEAENRPSLTRDGEPVRILTTMNLLSDLPLVLASGAEGIGLYRSEIPFLVRDGFPSEEEQTRIYRIMVETMGGKKIVFRTLDIGGDKKPDYLAGPTEANPALGLRAIRFSLRNPDVFAQQIRALLRASWDTELRILFPMISSVEEFRASRNMVRECQEHLRKEGISGNESPKIGVMIESPAAVEIIRILAREADFLSVGSNDLFQYVLAVDRTNAAVANLYPPWHPAMLRVLSRIAEAAQENGKELGLCGLLAADFRMTPFLIGAGYRTFTVDAVSVADLRARVAELDTGEAFQAARKAISCSTMDEAVRILGIEESGEGFGVQVSSFLNGRIMK